MAALVLGSVFSKACVARCQNLAEGSSFRKRFQLWTRQEKGSAGGPGVFNVTPLYPGSGFNSERRASAQLSLVVSVGHHSGLLTWGTENLLLNQ